MREASLKALKRLTKGKAALSRQEFEGLCADICSAKIDELADSLFPLPKKKAERPAWFDAMEAAKKHRKSWSASDFVAAVYEIAVEQNWITKDVAAKRPSKLSFKKAAERVAAISGSDALSSAFVRYIDLRVAQDRRT